MDLPKFQGGDETSDLDLVREQRGDRFIKNFVGGELPLKKKALEKPTTEADRKDFSNQWKDFIPKDINTLKLLPQFGLTLRRWLLNYYSNMNEFHVKNAADWQLLHIIPHMNFSIEVRDRLKINDSQARYLEAVYSDPLLHFMFWMAVLRYVDEYKYEIALVFSPPLKLYQKGQYKEFYKLFLLMRKLVIGKIPKSSQNEIHQITA